MNVDGTNVVRLTNNNVIDGDPAWSPDGALLAFQSWRDGGGAIWIMNADGSNAHRLVATNLEDQQPAWSPNGKRIAFSRRTATDSRDIFMVNSDGSGLTQLTKGLMQATDPSWSADGSQILLANISRDCLASTVRFIRVIHTSRFTPLMGRRRPG